MEKLKCPNCGSERIVQDDVLDDYTTNIGISEFCVGVCLDCELPLTWHANYKFVDFSDIQIA